MLFILHCIIKNLFVLPAFWVQLKLKIACEIQLVMPGIVISRFVSCIILYPMLGILYVHLTSTLLV